MLPGYLKYPGRTHSVRHYKTLPPVILVLPPQSSRQHLSTDTQLASACGPLLLDGFVSPHHHHARGQICNCVNP
ncbi:hypothetical protein JOB18_013243 [Solea senegalensis]|uniref:Uncharacterized protein n=1 Tax=Solea senegalensis TaxID=28829 RepID=A0AAV6PRU9_SOLSE|nr:hypothetical protein JOB18_013243 [Solea senegalensis]